jgi:SpoVK/Ycf46/Vps4 family AAA+-type ATPase
VWIDELIKKIDSKVSNIGIIITDDLARIFEVNIQLLQVDLTQFHNIVVAPPAVFDIQRYPPSQPTFQFIYDENGKASVQSIDANNLYEAIKQLATSRPVIVRYVINARQAELLENVIIALHTDTELYAQKPRFPIIIISNAYYWKFSDIPTTEPVPSEQDYQQLLDMAKQSYEKSYGLPVKLPSIDGIKGLTIWEAQGVINLSKRVTPKAIEFDEQTIMNEKREFFRKLGVELITPTITMEDVGGMKFLKKYINDYWLSIWQNRDIAKEYGVRPPKGILLFGAPGTGKTWFATALAGTLSRPMIKVDLGDFLSKWVGESEQRTKTLLKYAEISNAVIFFDEFDAIATKRSEGEHEVYRSVKNILLSWMTNQESAIIIGTTNRASDLDEAFLRPGRFDDLFPVLTPTDINDIAEIVKIHVERLRPISHRENIDYKEIGKAMIGLRPNEIEKVLNDAKLRAFLERRKLRADDIVSIAKEVKSRVEVRKRLEEEKKLVEQMKNLPNAKLEVIEEIQKEQQSLDSRWV